MEDLLVSHVRPVILLHDLFDPTGDFSLHFIEVHCLDKFFFLVLFLNDLSNLALQLLLIHEHVSALAPVCAARLCENFGLLIGHITSAIAMILHVFTKAEVD